ncbi:MAG: hypothetical protein ACLUOF_11425 [Ruminococcus sp.]
MIQRRNTATKRQTLLHCGALAAILGVVVGLIFLVHPGCVYGAQTDWSNQHFAIPEYFGTRFYATGNLFPTLPCSWAADRTFSISPITAYTAR